MTTPEVTALYLLFVSSSGFALGNSFHDAFAGPDESFGGFRMV